MFDLRTTILAFAVGLAVAGAGSWWATARYKDAQFAAAIAAQKIDAAAQLQTATERAIASERAYIRLADKVETEYHENQSALDRLTADNRRLARLSGGLRDPGPRPDCSGTMSSAAAAAGAVAAATTTADLSTAGQGLLSAAASDFILQLAADADRAAEYAQSCRRWASEIGQ